MKLEYTPQGIGYNIDDLAWRQASNLARKQGGNAEDYFDVVYDSLLEINDEE